MNMNVQTVLVIGAGQMGSGIAQVCAQAGYKVLLYDVDAAAIDRGIEHITKNLSRDVEKGRKTAEEKAAILERIWGSLTLLDAKNADVVIEAAVENMAI